MHACVSEGECELAGTSDARFEEAGLGYSHMHARTHTRQTKKRQAPGGWGSPQERVLAHRGGRNWALSARLWASSLFTWMSVYGYFCCCCIIRLSSYILHNFAHASLFSSCLHFVLIQHPTKWEVAQADNTPELIVVLRLTWGCLHHICMYPCPEFTSAHQLLGGWEHRL